MKKKIGEIYNKPIVTGDKNLVTKNEVHESNLGGSGGSSSSDMEYYKVDGMPTLAIIALYKIKTASGIKIQGVAEEYSEYTKAIAYAPISHNGVIYNNLKDLITVMSEGVTDEEIEEMFSMFTPITKEEFYDLNNI